MSTITATGRTVQERDAVVLPTASARVTWRTVGRVARRTGWLAPTAIGSSLAAAGLSVMAPYLLGSVVDLVIGHGSGWQLAGLIGLVVVVAVAGAIMTAVSYRLV